MNRSFPLLSFVVLALIIAFAACDGAGTSDVTSSDIEAGNEIALNKAAETVRVCHVGSELPEYDPNCTENCGDAGKIDLIEVSVNAYHLGNPAHAYGGVSDYLPGDEGASGVGTEDSDGDGVDDGCEIPEDPYCPCFTTEDLVEGGPIVECGENFPGFSDLAAIIYEEGVEGRPGKACSGINCVDPVLPSCAISTAADQRISEGITAEEDAGCRTLILDICPNPNSPGVLVPESTVPFMGQ
jgi:hypothetical protein